MSEVPSEDTQGPSKWRGLVQLLIIVAVVAAAIFLARAPQQDFLQLDVDATGQRIEPTAAVILPSTTSTSHEIDLTGTVITLGNVAVLPEAAGDIVFVSEKFRPGGEFTADETLAQIDTTEYDIALELSKLDLEFANAHLKEVKDRYGRSAEYFATRPDGTVHPWPALDGEIEKAEAMAKSASQRLRLAEIQLDKTRIRVPFDGYVTASSLSVGQVVSSASTVGTVYAKHQLQVRAQISQSDLATLEPAIGRTASIKANNHTYRAEVERVSTVVDLETRLASLHLRLLDQENLAVVPRPGTFAKVSVEGPMHEAVFLVSEATRQLNSSVWIVDDGKLVSFEPRSRGYKNGVWIVDAFDVKDGLVIGSVAGAKEGLAVNAISSAER